MNKSFIENIRENKIIQPTKIGFKITQWDHAWENILHKDAKDKNIYESGKIFFSLFEEIRSELKKLHEFRPNIDNENLLKIFFALSNRDRSILSRRNAEICENNSNIFSATLNYNLMNNEITLDEIANGCVDGIYKAIYFCMTNKKFKLKIKKGVVPLDIIDFITKEAYLSQLYGMYESYWHAILWGGYKLVKIDNNQNIYCVQQNKNTIEAGALISNIRKNKLDAQTTGISTSINMENKFSTDNYISVKRNGKEKKINSLSISLASQHIRWFNTSWRLKQIYLIDEFPAEILNNEFENGFSINDALDIFRCLMLLSCQYMDKYPKDDGFQKIHKLLLFCPKIKKIELINGLVKATKFSPKKVLSILNFIEFDASDNKDLWCHPIISIKNNEYIILTSSLITPVINRVVEHWLVKLNIGMQDKGLTYESSILNDLNDAVASNVIINDFDKGISKRIKLLCGEEEIDLLIRIGNVILIGEAKSIVTTDSPISQYRTIEILKKASYQVKRKSKFVQDNLKHIFDYLGWSFNEKNSYNFVECIINSGRMYVGCNIDDIPVCDEKILTKYFRSNIVPYISTLGDDGKKEHHLAWFTLYENFEELQAKIGDYLRRPPQVDISLDDFEYKDIILPFIKDTSYKMIFRRLVPKDLTPQDRLEKAHIFPIRMTDNIEEELAKIHITI